MSERSKIRERVASIKAVLWTSKTLADGPHPFVIRIHKDDTRKHITTGLSPKPQFWNPAKEGVRQSYPAVKREASEQAL